MEERTINCSINELKITNIQKQIDVVIDDLKMVKSQNITQNDLLTRFDLMITAINQEKQSQKEINKEFIGTLKNMNDNLSLLNQDMGNVKKDIEGIKDEQNIINSNANKTKIDWLDLATSAIKNLITVAIGGGVVYLISVWVQSQ